jgi:hypothetical protein
VDIRTERPQSRLSRVHGDITEIDSLTSDFQLCQTVYVSQWDDDGSDSAIGTDDRRCVTVSTDDATGIFGEDGMPQAFEDLAVGEKVTVIGRLRRLADDEEDDSGANDDDSNDDDSDGDSDDDSSGDNDGNRNYFALDAYVIEEGPLDTFRRVPGTVASAVDPSTSRFGLAVDAGHGISTEMDLPVQLFDSSRIFNRDGEELGRDDIVIDRIALADGVLAIGDEDVLRSPLVMLGDLAPGDSAAIEGTIVDVNTADGTLLVNDGTMDRCVNAAAAEIFIVDDSDGFSSSRGELADLGAGQPVSIFGMEALDGCLVADTILADAPGVDPL